MTYFTILMLIAGLALLVAGAEFLVRGASKLAVLAGISPLVIGLTIVAYGTSSPEMAVSIHASLSGKADISLGNVVGSNIFNVLAILGLASIISPLPVAQQLIRLDVPIMIVVSGVLFLFSLDGNLNHLEGSVLFLGAVVYTVFLIYQSRKETNLAVQAEYQQEYGGQERNGINVWGINLVLILGGLVLLVLGSQWLTTSAVTIARTVGLSELVIGLTLIATGTSLPELASSVIASLKGEQDIAVGNVVGSNIFNILAVLGLAAVFSPTGVPVASAALNFDIPFMVAVAVACLPIFFSGNRINRLEGVMFLFYYAAYTIYLILKSTEHHQLPLYNHVMQSFVVPITVITLLVITLNTLRIKHWVRR
jgi:cation:H+ antiporter